MKKETVPFNYVINKLSYETQLIFKYLYSIYGFSTIILVTYLIHRRNKL